MSRWQRNSQLDILLGGKWAISTRGALIIFPLALLAAPYGNASGQDNYPILKWIFISAASMLPSSLLYILAGFTIFKNRNVRPLPWWCTLVLGGLLGALKGTVMAFIAYKVGLEDRDLASAIQERASNHFFVGVSLFTLVTITLAAYDRYTIQRNRLLRQAMAQNSLEMAINSELDGQKLATNSRAIQQVENSLNDTKKYLADVARHGARIDGYEIAEYLREKSASTIRPLSHKLWQPNLGESGARRFIGAINWGFRSVEIFPEIIILGYGFTTISTFFKKGYATPALQHFMLYILVLYGLLIPLRIIFKFLKNSGGFTKVVSILIFSGIFARVVEFLSLKILKMAISNSNFFADALWLAFVILSISAFMSIFAREESFLRSLQSVITESELRFTSNKIAASGRSRALASYLHSHLQSALINSASVIEQASDLGDDEAVIRELNKVQEYLHLPDAEDLNQSSNSLELAIKRSKANWDGLIEVKSRFTGTAKSATSSEIRKIENVLDEALSNAFRHGKAKSVMIEINASPATIQITVTDDGVGVTTNAEGMGSQTFDTIAGSAWELTQGPGKGARLKLSIERG